MALASMARQCGVNVAQIIMEFKNGNTRDYDVMVAGLSKPDLGDKMLADVLRKSRECVSLIDKDCEYFVGALLALDWTSRDSRVIIEYQAFLLNLVSAQMCFLRPCLRMLVAKFIPVVQDDVGVSCDQVLADSSRFVNVHSLLKSITQIIPMAPNVLVPLISEKYPYVTKHVYVHEYYVRNLLQICQYLPNQRKDLLAILISKLLELDARASREDILDTIDGESDNDSESEDVFHMESDEPGNNEANSSQSPMSHEEANKLDTCMSLLLEYVRNGCYVNGELNWEVTKKLYKELLTIFDTIILRTFSCAHVQFVIFYICSFKLALSEGFIDYLWKKVRDPNTQPVFRQAAVAYLSSLLARAKYIPINTVLTTLEVMVEWIHAYIRNTTHSTCVADVIHHGPFYSVCQAVFYVFLFRHREILELPKGLKICVRFNFAAIATCRLNPLKICLPMIASTFSRITRMHQLAYCDAIIERNNRSIIPLTTLSQTGAVSKLSRSNQLDSFFPFDPFLLNRSRSYVSSLYQEFLGSPVINDEETSLSEDEDDFAVDDGESSMRDLVKATLASSPSDFLSYGTSPGFKQL